MMVKSLHKVIPLTSPSESDPLSVNSLSIYEGIRNSNGSIESNCENEDASGSAIDGTISTDTCNVDTNRDRSYEQLNTNQISPGILHSTPILNSSSIPVSSRAIHVSRMQPKNNKRVTDIRHTTTFIEKISHLGDEPASTFTVILPPSPENLSDDELQDLFVRSTSHQDREHIEDSIILLLRVIVSRVNKFVGECNSKLKSADIDPQTTKAEYEKQYRAFEKYILDFDIDYERSIMKRSRQLRDSELPTIIRNAFEYNISELNIEHANSIGFPVAYEGCLPLLRLLYEHLFLAKSSFTSKIQARTGLNVLLELNDTVDKMISQLLAKEFQIRDRYDEAVETLYIAINQTYNTVLPKARILYNRRRALDLFKEVECEYTTEQVRNDGTKYLESVLELPVFIEGVY
ncbi:hypothetical protein BEWA_015160 [Theileria equi strain WA]|uniref:Uncharacterized protein n=1 Tax=Theileria equi strain WA TaxID=1537102 RepID=L1LBY2_THEEQ|nr:hypothetical protein BEWA_015160 [Theileria equi strain WA]EKX72957.1 hypothetical protein BEWA_015160 [Theileria equi strain WA]|eukprot:XP_004832409.1 hypothetical protein BEWA_015160 [Theileria equi strain WA]